MSCRAQPVNRPRLANNDPARSFEFAGTGKLFVPPRQVFFFRNLTFQTVSDHIQGRSPYDVIVPGTGEANPREPVQTYDERGRPYNAETRRVNRNIIRAHNEVMQVIGVAEPESLLTAENETNKQLIQQLHEDRLGWRLYKPLRMISAVGLWGTEPLRQRALVCTCLICSS